MARSLITFFLILSFITPHNDNISKFNSPLSGGDPSSTGAAYSIPRGYSALIPFAGDPSDFWTGSKLSRFSFLGLLVGMTQIKTAWKTLQVGDWKGQPTFTVVGSVINLSGDQESITGSTVLTVYSGAQIINILATPLQSDGSYEFAEVPFAAEYTYIVSFKQNGITFSAQKFEGSRYAAGDIVSTEVMFFNATSDTSLLRGEGMHTILNFNMKGTVHVSESMIFYNPSSLVIIPADEQTPVLIFKLDSHASALEFFNSVNNETFKVMDGGFGDWQQILPGSVHQVMFEYDLPFDGDENITLRVPMHMDTIIVTKEDNNASISCKSAQLVSTRVQYSGKVELFNGLSEGEQTTMTIRCVAKNHELWYFVFGIAAFGFLVLSFFGVRRIWKSKRQKDILRAQTRRTQIMDSVIALDDKFKANEISREIYEMKRAELIKSLEGVARSSK